jgi:hypothetical protein
MRMMSWVLGLGVIALAVLGWALPKRQKNTWEKAVDWTSHTVSPMSRMVRKTSKKMIKGMVR